MGQDLGPHVPDAASALRQVIEGVEPIKVINRQVRHRLRRRETNVDPHPATPVRIGPHGAPRQDTGAAGAKMKFEERVVSFPAPIDRSDAKEPDPLTFPAIGLERPIATADCTVAGRDRPRITIESPLDRAAVTDAFH